MGTVVNKTSFQIKRSVNSPDFSQETWVLNPSTLDSLVGTGTDRSPEVDKRYWVVDPPTSQNLREMTTAEKTAIDTDLDSLSGQRDDCKVKIRADIERFLFSLYPEATQAALSALHSSLTGDQRIMLVSYQQWRKSVYSAQADAEAAIDAALTVPDILAVSVDYDALIASDPKVSPAALVSSDPGSGGKHIVLEYDEGIMSTSSSQYVTKTTTPMVNVSSGPHLISYSYGWRSSKASKDVEVQLQVDDGSGYVDVGSSHKQEIADSDAWGRHHSADQSYFTSRKAKVTLASGPHTWKLIFRAQGGGFMATLFEVMIKVEEA